MTNDMTVDLDSILTDFIKQEFSLIEQTLFINEKEYNQKQSQNFAITINKLDTYYRKKFAAEERSYK